MKRVILLAVLIAVTDLVFVSAAWAPSRGMRAVPDIIAAANAPAPPAAASRAAAPQESTVIADGGTVKAAKKHTAKAVKKASPTATATATAKATASPTATATAAAAELPPTGGAPAIALGAAGLLIAGGLLARRIVR